MDLFWMDVSPEYIFYDCDPRDGSKKFKLLLLELVYRDRFFAVKQTKIGASQFVYAHVEMLDWLAKGQTDLVVNYFKENTYSLGLIVLSLAMHFNLEALYCYQFPTSQGTAHKAPGTRSRRPDNGTFRATCT